MAEVSFGEWLKRRRKGLGWTQQQLAAQIHCSTVMLKKIEAEERHPSAQIVERLAKILNIPQNEQASFLRFARGDWRTAPRASLEEAPWRASATSPHSNLPASLTSLIGREQELAKLSEYLSNPNVRLVTLIGPPGIGKTSLSLQVAREALDDFANGVFFVALAPLEDPSLVAPTVSQILGFVEIPNQSPLERLQSGIGEKQMLIVLDNAEHLVEETANLVSEILPVCSRVRILITSREALRVKGEWLYYVSTLKIPDESSSIDMETISQYSALTLFAERARAVQSNFTLNADIVQSVVTICTQLDGLPLAIELIAARIRLMSPHSLLAHLSNHFVLYADGMRAVAARHKTLHNAIDWSYKLLSVEEQKLFARLSVFVGGFTHKAAEAVAAGDDISQSEVTNLLGQLINKSLVTVEANSVGNYVDTRYGMLETIREYAHEKLNEWGQTEQLRHRHRDFFIAFAERAEPKLGSAEQFEWLDRLEIEHDNLRAAWGCAIKSDTELALRLVSALLDFWWVRGNPNEGDDWSMKLLSHTNEWGQTAKRARALGIAGRLRYLIQNLASARLLLEESLSIARMLGDKRQIAFALDWLGEITFRQRDDQASQNYAAESFLIFQELQDQWGIARALSQLASVATNQGHYAEAEEQSDDALAKLREISGHFSFRKAYLLNWLGELARTRGDYEQAGILYEENLEILRKLRSRVIMAAPTYNLGWVSLQRNEYQKAKALFREALRLYSEYGNKAAMTDCLSGFAAIMGKIGKPEQAVSLFSAMVYLYEEIGEPVVDPSDQKELDFYLEAVRHQLDEATFVNAWGEGRSMSLEQAIAYALEETANP